ncbi:MAG: class I SAM-dependent methyltransferase [Pseudomonadota bacterium]
MDKHKIHAANKARWDAGAERWAKLAEQRGSWRRCVAEPELVLCPNELEYLDDVSGKSVCVLGSGDNQVVFALAGLGADVTSVDVSERQLDVARERAQALGLTISFMQADVVDLSELSPGSFDVVYTGGHVAVWVADLVAYYAEAARVLRTNGLFIVNEYHPFRRIWRDSIDTLEVEASYYERGPFEYHLDDDILRPKGGNLVSFEFRWTVSDYINAVLDAGCVLVNIDEYGEHVGDWEGAPMAGLPEFLLVIARKAEQGGVA